MSQKKRTEPQTVDKVYDEVSAQIADFSFNQKIARVFDDMVSRSVPYYDEIQRMSCELAADFAVPNSNLFDIGCSTATTLLALDEKVDSSVRFVGIDKSEDMLKKAEEKVAQSGMKREIDFQAVDLHEGLSIENASVITMLLTLQFVRPRHCERVMQKLYDGLKPNGCLILVEKLTCEHTDFNRLFIQHYHEYKRRMGYSDTEIYKKREALENVLIPYHIEENFQLMKGAGFRYVEEYFRWYNFCGIIAVK